MQRTGEDFKERFTIIKNLNWVKKIVSITKSLPDSKEASFKYFLFVPLRCFLAPYSWILSIINVWTWSLRICHPLFMPDNFSPSLPGSPSVSSSSASLLRSVHPQNFRAIAPSGEKLITGVVLLPLHVVSSSSSSSSCAPIFNLSVISSGSAGDLTRC